VDRSLTARIGRIVLAGALLATASTATPQDVSQEVRERIATGAVVVTRAMPPGASKGAKGGTAMAIVRAAPEQVWRVIVDPRTHPQYYPRVTSAETVEGDERHMVVRYEVSVRPFSFTFYVDKYPDAVRRRIEWRLAQDRPQGLFKENSGYWQVDPAGPPDESLVTYAIAVRTLLPAAMTGGAETVSLTDTVVALRKLVEPQR
jgi:ribosome-associated toxin RatA of RatAB toxin-antitoxin module